jgi:acyl-CoA thioesterase-1
MNPIVLSFADGTTFFVGLAVTLIADLLLLRIHRGIVRSVLNVLVVVGIVFVIISATPLPIWAYSLLIVTTATCLVIENLIRAPRHLRLIATGFLIVITAGLCITEAPYHFLPRITVPHGKRVYVLGDSISAGMGTKDRCWPAVLGDISPFTVVNLAQAGATAESAIKQADGILESNSVVIVEIGGNDLLDDTKADVFRSQIESLVSLLRRKQQQVLVIELPLFPFQNAYGKAQRSIVTKYGAVLLPKRCLTKVFGLKNGTLDGLHLSQEGHNAFAKIIAGVLHEE